MRTIYWMFYGLLLLLGSACSDQVLRSEIKDKDLLPVFLEFSNIEEFNNFIFNQGSFQVPANFISLEKIIGGKINNFKLNKNFEEIKGYYIFEEGILKSVFRFLSFSKALNEHHLVSINGKVYKFDFDTFKYSMTNNLEDLLNGIDLVFENSEWIRSPLMQIGPRAKCVVLYADFLNFSGIYYASLNADILFNGTGLKMNFGSFTCDGGWLGASLANRTTFGSISQAFSGSTWSYPITSWAASCSDSMIQLHFTDGIFQCIVFDPNNNPLDPLCGVYLTPVFFAETIHPCP